MNSYQQKKILTLNASKVMQEANAKSPEEFNELAIALWSEWVNPMCIVELELAMKLSYEKSKIQAEINRVQFENRRLRTRIEELEAQS